MGRDDGEYIAGLNDGREIRIDSERVANVTRIPCSSPIVDAKAPGRHWRLASVQFAQAPHFNHVNADYNVLDEFLACSISLSVRGGPVVPGERWLDRWALAC
jgi:hypothetical protein